MSPRLAERLETSLLPVLPLLQDETVEDICANVGCLWVERRGQAPELFDASYSAFSAMDVITNVAALNNRVVNYRNPVIEATLPFESVRFHGIIPPLAEGPIYSIRTRPRRVIPLDAYVTDGTVSPVHASVLFEAVVKQKNIIVAGSTGSGKTTFLNSLLEQVAAVAPRERIITIEDTLELQCMSANRVALHAANGMTMRACLRNALRMVPKRIVVGEVRGKEALDLIMAWNTGHRGGMGTVHANSAVEALNRFEQLVRLYTRDVGKTLRQEIAQAIDYVAFLQKDPNSPSGRRLMQLVSVGWNRAFEGDYEIKEIEG